MKDIFRWTEDTTTLDFAAGAITGMRQSAITRKLARVWTPAGVVSVGTVGDTADEELWHRCEQNSVAAMPANAPAPAPTQSARFEAPKKSPGDLEKALGELLAEIRRDLPDFIPQGKFAYGSFEREYRSRSAVLSSRQTLLDGYFYLKHRSSSNIIDHIMGAQSDDVAALAQIVSPQLAWMQAWERRSQLPAGRYPVCMASDVGEMFGKLSHSLNPEVYHSGAGLFSGMAGKSLFHPQLTIRDLARDAAQGKWRPFDDEGTERGEAHDVVKAGVFTGPLYDLRTAHKFGARSTGHSVRTPQGGASVASGGLTLAPGPRGLEEMLAQHADSVLVLVAGGGDTTADGEFSMPTQVAFHLRAGKVVGQLPSLTIRGNLRDYLGNDFLGVAREPLAPGLCPPLMATMEVILN